MTFSYFSLLKNLNSNSGVTNTKLLLLKKLRRVNKKVFLKNVYFRNNLSRKHSSFKFKYLSSRFISTNLKFKVYKKDFYNLKKSFLFFYKINRPILTDFSFINFYQKKNKFYYKYFLTTKNISDEKKEYFNILKLNAAGSFTNILIINKPIVYKISNKFSKYKNSVFLETFNYKYIYNHFMIKQKKVEQFFKSFLKAAGSSFYFSKNLYNLLLLKENNEVSFKTNYIKDTPLISFKKLNTFINFINKNELLLNSKIWFFLKKYKLILKKFSKSNNFILFFKNKLKFNKSIYSYFLNFSNFSEFYFLENLGLNNYKGSLIHNYFMNSQRIILFNFFKFFQSNKNFNLNKNILNNLNLLQIVHFNDILKYRKLKIQLFNKNMFEFKIDSNFFNYSINKEILYNFYNKQFNFNRDIILYNNNRNSYLDFYNSSNSLLNNSLLVIIKKFLIKNFFIITIDLNKIYIPNIYFMLVIFYRKLYYNKFNNYFLKLSIYDF